MEEKEEGSEQQEPKRQVTMIQNAYINGIEPMSYPELLLADSYKGNSADLPWLGSATYDLARMQLEKAERKKKEKPKEERPS